MNQEDWKNGPINCRPRQRESAMIDLCIQVRADWPWLDNIVHDTHRTFLPSLVPQNEHICCSFRLTFKRLLS